MVSGDRPSERQPSQVGMKSTHGIMCPSWTSLATFIEVVIVQ